MIIHPVKGKKKTWEQVNPHTSILLGGMSKVPIATAVVVGDSAGNASSNLATTQSAFSMPPKQGSQYDQFLGSDEYGKDYGRLHVSTPLNLHYLFRMMICHHHIHTPIANMSPYRICVSFWFWFIYTQPQICRISWTNTNGHAAFKTNWSKVSKERPLDSWLSTILGQCQQVMGKRC